PNQFDLLRRGDTNLEAASDAFYYGLRNTQGGAVFAVNGRNSQRSHGDLPQAGYQNRELPLVEQVEVYNTATNFTTWLAFSLATAQDVDGDGLSNQQEASLSSDYENPDTDGNGLSDGFEYLYFGTPMGNDPNADPDGDGLTNLQEYIAGTAPTNPASAVRITSLTPQPDGAVVIKWDCVPGKRYQVQYRDDLSSGDWNPVSADSILATTTTPNYPAPIPPGQTKRFYRVKVVQ
ncbi:MAG: hypothetical protein N3A53_04345, partial [Verrucomicrobiae bacterium]|nr:hypothetical protein [Verrucomicrobiae bacterium]